MCSEIPSDCPPKGLVDDDENGVVFCFGSSTFNAGAFLFEANDTPKGFDPERDLFDVVAVDDENGFFFGSFAVNVGTFGMEIDDPLKGFDVELDLFDVVVVDDENGFCFGSSAVNIGGTFAVEADDPLKGFDVEVNFFDVVVVDDENGFCFGSSIFNVAAFVIEADGLGAEEDFVDVVVVDDENGFCFGSSIFDISEDPPKGFLFERDFCCTVASFDVPNGLLFFVEAKGFEDLVLAVASNGFVFATEVEVDTRVVSSFVDS